MVPFIESPHCFNRLNHPHLHSSSMLIDPVEISEFEIPTTFSALIPASEQHKGRLN
jgi:hypothetical protein